MKIYDISRTLQEAPLYKGDEPPEITQIKSVYKEKDLYSLSKITMFSHSGTHADAFSHFLKFAQNIDEMDLDLFYGPAKVITFNEGILKKEDLKDKLNNVQRLIIRGNGKSFLSKDGAQFLSSKKVKLIVTDALSVAASDNEAEIHKILFSAGIGAVENAVLDAVSDGDYILSAFPVKIKGCDGAPARAVLIK
ncbi:MAG: cyclase family protein [Endomicrobium sp.]|jgi:arylformamidase|nr:cyclase family protein [Endomicrobium sp.]